MFQGLDKSQMTGALEALLFVTDEPVSALRLAEMLEVELSEVEAALDELQAALAEANRGIQLREVAGGWRLYTHPAYHDLIEQYVISWDTRKLTAAALETLAIVAYTQPTTRASVSSIRGVNSDSSINSLMEKGLLREAGASDAPGNPTLYATSRAFLEKFGLRSVGDLPDLAEFVPDEETRELIRERLSARRVSDGTLIEADSDAAEQAASPLDQVVFELEDDDDEEIDLGFSGAGQHIVTATDDERDVEPSRPVQGGFSGISPASLLAQAIAQTSGAVEKIDFDKLVFEDDDE